MKVAYGKPWKHFAGHCICLPNCSLGGSLGFQYLLSRVIGKLTWRLWWTIRWWICRVGSELTESISEASHHFAEGWWKTTWFGSRLYDASGTKFPEESRNRSHFASPLTLARLFVLFKGAGQRCYRHDRFHPFAETLRSFSKNAREANATWYVAKRLAALVRWNRPLHLSN